MKKKIFTILLLIFFVCSFIISNMIYEWIQKSNQSDYESVRNVTQIYSEDELNSFLKTSEGKVFLYGKLSADNVQTHEFLKGEYSSIKIITEIYQEHTERRSRWTGKFYMHYNVEVKDWEERDEEKFSTKKVKILGVELPLSKLSYPYKKLKLTKNNVNAAYKNKIAGNYIYFGDKDNPKLGDVRICFQVRPKSNEITLYSIVEKGKLKPSGEKYITYSRKPEEIVADAVSNADNNVVAFFISYILIMGFLDVMALWIYSFFVFC